VLSSHAKIHKYTASSLVRRFNNLIRLVVEHRFRLLFGTKSSYFENKKRDAFNLLCNFLYVSFRLGLGGSFALEIMVRWLPANSCLMQYLDNFKLSTRDTEE